MTLQEIIGAVQDYLPNADVELVRKAYAFVREKHQGQTRASGEPYVTHVQEVAFLVTKLRLDVQSVATALLHDTVEDTAVSLTQISADFGKEIAELVDGVTKLSQVNFSSRAEAQAENFRKMLLAMARDIRVLLIKLCDRLHNMRTLEFLSEGRRTRIAQETLDIYAPLCHRLGIYWMKSELEDLSLRFLKPAAYESIKKHVSESKREREAYIKDVTQLITRELAQNNITGDVSGRPKHFYSIYEKMEREGLDFSEIYDLIAFRIIVPTLMDCYTALGLVHAAWKPIPGRFKDYIAMPKPNNYQSLHTTVIGPKGARIEIQIRTQEMHDVAERGIAAHWIYKETADGKKAIAREGFQFTWLRDLVESEQTLKDPIEFLSTVKEDLFSQEVFVFSPKGDLIALASTSTPIDFAYYIHSEVGHHCVGARVNGQQVGLSYRLQNGDTVEIITSKTQSPSKDWLNLVATNKAKQRIRSFLKAAERERSITVGKELMTKDLRQVKLSYSSVLKDGRLQKAADELGLKEIDILLAEIGYGKISTKQVITLLVPEESDLDSKLEKEDSALQRIFQRAAKVFREKAGVKVNGYDDVVFRFAKCCEPLPGNELVGYVTRGRGVAIHTRGCPQTLSFDPRRLIPVTWDDTVKTTRRIRLHVLSADRVGILAALTQCISNAGANIVNAQVNSTPHGKALSSFEVNIESSGQLDTITRAIEKVDGVIRIERHRYSDE
ncbi:MAG: bifunctional (p)ppGpp synthetase/guanosine-3',5'-bis(diphosphate) 3'-pyrophosphohydrolase [Bdellovibrionota bacterium]